MIPIPTKPPTVVLSLLVAAPCLLGQQVPAYSRHDFQNGYFQTRLDAFANARSDTGNAAGDLLYKVWPKEVFARDEDIRISGLRIWFQADSSYSGSFPVSIKTPQVAFYPVVQRTIAGKVYDVPDLDNPATPVLKLQDSTVVRSGVVVLEVKVHPFNFNPDLRQPIVLKSRDKNGEPQGWAVGLLAPPGEKLGDGKATFVGAASFGEVHRLPGPSTYSGLYDARGKRLIPYGTPGAPSNLGELGIELMLDAATLQVFSDASGGVRNDPKQQETHKGPGAYCNALASAVRTGWFGLFCQWEKPPAGSTLCLPLVTAIGAAMPDKTLAIDKATLLVDPARAQALTAFLQAGVLGTLALYKKNGVAGHRADQPGVFVTPRIPVPRDPALKDATMWVQALLLANGGFPGASNVVRVRF